MGVINITQRSERLGNIGGTSTAHGVTNTDIGTVRHTSARVFSPTYYVRNSHAGDAAITSGLAKIGDAMTRIGAAVMQREEDRKVDDYANAMLDSMEKQGRDDRDIDDWNTPDRKHLQGQKRGFYLRTGEGTKTVVDEWDRAFADTFRKIGDSIDANDRVRERTMDKLANYRRATVSRLADNQAAEYRRMEMDSAKGNLSSQIALWKNGRTEILPDIFAQQERVDNLSLATPEKRKANREALALKLTADFVGNSLDQCQTPEDFDKVEEAVNGGLKDALPDMIADNLPGGERTIGGEYRKAILGEVKKAKRLFLAERDAEEREARQAIGRDFTERELKLRDVPQELWADAYEAMGRDETLRKADPKRAMAYMDAASEMRTAASKAKEKASADAIKRTEDGLYDRLLWLIADRSTGNISKEKAAQVQADLWRDYAVAANGRTIGADFTEKFTAKLDKMLNEQQIEAMRYTMQLFGYDAELDSSGRLTASERKKAERDGLKFYAPFEEEHWYGDSKPKISPRDLFSFLDSQWRTLETSDKGGDRLQAAKEAALHFKEGWLRNGLGGMIEAGADAIMQDRVRRLAEEEEARTE